MEKRSTSSSSSKVSEEEISEYLAKRAHKKVSFFKVSEEKISEYLAKRAHKKAIKVAKKLKTQSVSGYANESNPYGDSNLNET